MAIFKFALFGLLTLLPTLASGSKCPQETTGKHVVCYYKGEISLESFNICNCTHVIFTEGVRRHENNSLTLSEDAEKQVAVVKERKSDLLTLFSLKTKPDESSIILKSDNRTEDLINGIVGFLRKSRFDGLELDFRFKADDGVLKQSYASFVKDLSKALPSRHPRVKREGYDVFEKVQDDVTTAAYPTQTPKNGTTETQSILKAKKKVKNTRKIREDKEEDAEEPVTLEEAINREFSKIHIGNQTQLNDVEDGTSTEENKFLVFVKLSIKPEVIAKKYDLKVLSRYADVMMVPTHDIVNKNEEGLTYHPSRLMGLSDILNTDSILDFLTGMGALKSKIVISFPATVLKFQLKDINKNTPRSPSVSKPQVIDQSQMCSLFSKSNWTVERDDDLTAPYAFSGKTWMAFEDETSVKIKGKYILLRELAGGAIYPIDADVNEESCTNRTGSGGFLTRVLHDNFKSLERKPRALVLESLQEEIHDTTFQSIEAGVKLSEYRIVRVVDHSGAVHVIRKNTKTQFECSRQGYFSHPLGCNKFYRCVKFDQYSDEFTVFEYDCPAGLAFDERWEVCVWPGSLPHGAPCTGSSEIAPVPRSHFQCPSQEGYYADPENCRWFFACLDHARDGYTPLTAYEFRCPFGLVFNEQSLSCDWPWVVGACGSRGASGFIQAKAGGQSQGLYSATFINGGNLEASFGQFGDRQQELGFSNFGKGFGTVLKEIDTGKGSYPAQSADFGYVANRFDKNGRGSFASFPEYEISGGKILNKGGVLLNGNTNFGGFSGGVVGGGARTSGETKLFGSGLSFQQNIQSGIGGGNVVPLVEIQKVTPAPGLAKATIVQTTGGLSGGAQVSFQNPISTPRPFSVNVPSVQINEEKLSGFGGHSTIQSTTAPNLLLVEPGNVQNNGASFGTSTVSLGVTPKPQVHRFGQSTFHHQDISGGISVTQPSVSVVSPVVTKSFQSTSVGSGGVTAGQPVSVGVPVVTPKPAVQTFEYTASGHGLGVGLGVSQPTVSISSPVVGFTEQRHGIVEQGKAFGQSSVSVQIPAVTPTVQTHVFENTNSGQVSGNVAVKQSYGVPLVTTKQFGYSSGQSGVGGITVTPKPILHDFQQTTIDKEILSELKFNKPASSIGVVSVTPKTDFNTFSHTGSGVISEQFNVNLPSITGKPEINTFSQFGSKPFGGTSTISYDVPSVTPKTDVSAFSYYSGQTSGVGVTPVVPVKLPTVTPAYQSTFGQTGNVEFSKVSFGAPTVTPKTEIHGFGQKVFQSGVQSGQEEISFGVPAVTPASVNTQTVVHTGGVSQGSVLDISNVQQSVKPVIGQQFSYSTSFKNSGSQFSSIEPFKSVSSTPAPAVFNQQEVLIPKAEKPKTITHVSIEQQPILSVGTITSIGYDQGASTPKPYTQTSGINTYNTFKSTYFQPKQPVPVTTPVPVVSITPSVTYHQSTPNTFGVNTFAKTPQTTIYRQDVSFQPEKVDLTVPAVHQDTTFGSKTFNFEQKSLDFNKEIKSFTPVAHVTTTRPFTYQQEVVSAVTPKTGFIEQSNVYSAPVTPKIDIFRPKIQQISSGVTQFGNEQIVQHQDSYRPVDFEFVKTKPLIHEQRVQHIQQQVPVQVTTTSPEFQKVLNPVPVSTSKPFLPQGELLEISKSVELNPSQFFESNNQYFPSQSTTASPIVIEKQPVRLLSQKTFPDKGVIQPFYKQQSFNKDVVQTQINTIPQTGYQDQFVFQQQIPSSTPKTYIPPVSYSTAKTTIVDQPVYSQVVDSVTPTPIVPIVQNSGVSFTGHKDTIVTKVQSQDYQPSGGIVQTPGKTVFVGQYERQQPQVPVTPKVNLLLPFTTEPQQYAPPLTEEISIQQHNNFNFQKTNSFNGGKARVQNVFIQPEVPSTVTPSVSIFKTSGQIFGSNTVQNLTSGSGHSLFGPGVKYSINPNIAIPEPPQEYLLAHNVYTTVAPETSSRVRITNKAGTKASNLGQYKSTTYLPPAVTSRRRPSSKATLISVGNVDEQEIHDDNIQQILDKYSGSFGEVISGDKERFVTQVIKGDGAGEIRQGSSTVRYEVSSSTTARPKSRGRQYHGGLTSGIQATNKYEEYEIEGDKGNQRSFGGDSSKTTIDLTNLKLDKNKKTVIVVSQVSDANPLLVGKLAGQCSCQSNMLELRGKGKKSGSSSGKSEGYQLPPTIYNEYLPPFRDGKEGGASYQAVTEGGASGAVEVTPETVLIGGARSQSPGVSYESQQSVVSSSTTPYPDVSPSTILSSLGTDGVLPITPKTLYADGKLRNRKKQFRGRTRYLAPTSGFGGKLSEDGSAPLLSPVPASEIASTVDYGVLRGDESRTQNEIEGGRGKALAGAAFDRYGPGGWRGFDETLQGSVDCKRPGLFRHPKYCNKFYACNYDPWKERYTLHVFNCPIHLTYDSSISACNWPVGGPACADDNLLV